MNWTRKNLFRPALSALLPFLMVACSSSTENPGGDSDQELAEDGSETAAVENDAETLASSLVLETPAGPGAYGVIVGVSGYRPEGCLTKTEDLDEHKVILTFNDCTGPKGLLHLTGTITVVYEATDSSLTIHYSSTDFKINRASIDSWRATAVFTADGAARAMQWDAELKGHTARGRSFERTNHKTATWEKDGECVTVNGQSTGTVLARPLKTTFTNYQRCRDEACPSADSKVKVENTETHRSVEIEFKGGPHATITLTGTDGKSISRDFAPLCGG